ncbi:hypothetical protein HYV49_05805 [Candidatus Pacearchaeota archaeon]|nr:hypothetical protein [Candidatus Pacearchaeota archaeon]
MVDYNLEEIMKLPVEKRPKELEKLAAQIMTPQMMTDYYEESGANEGLDNYFNGYINELTRFAFAKKKNHQEFRKFLSEHKMIFGDNYDSFKKMTKQQINYVLARVREEQVGIVEKEFYEFLNSSK